MVVTDSRRRWVLAVVCLAVLVTSIDSLILNVALPTLVRDLDASTSELQWIVDAYILVFAGFLLVGGSLGDRFGRAKILRFGLVVFGVASAVAAFSDERDGTGDLSGRHGVRGGTDHADVDRGPDECVHRRPGAWPGAGCVVRSCGIGPGPGTRRRWVAAVAVLVGLGVPGECPDHRRGVGGGLVGASGVPEP